MGINVNVISVIPQNAKVWEYLIVLEKGVLPNLLEKDNTDCFIRLLP